MPDLPADHPPTRLHIDLSDGIHRTYDVTRYSIDEGVLRLFAAEGPDGSEVEIAAFAVGGWLRFERDRPVPAD